MTPRFLNFIGFILEWEGGYDNDPSDPGGETNFGIDKRSHSGEDIKHLTKQRATEIYFESYWTRCHCEDLPKNVGEVVMNIAVNAGPARAGKWLQRAVGANIDGDIGQETVNASNRAGSGVAVILLDDTEEHYRSIARGKLAKYLHGWLNRNNSLRAWVKDHS